MKRNYKQTNNSWLQRLTLFVVSMICVVGSLQASERYYYRYTATPTTGGQVYASNDGNSTKDYSSEPVTNTGSKRGDGFAEVTFYFYAKPDPGYTFLGWKKNGAGDYVSTNRDFTTIEKITSRSDGHYEGAWYNPVWIEDRTQVNYTAYFQEITGIVKVESNDVTKGSVGISNANNRNGDRITITAYPETSKGIVFLGWKTSNSATDPYVTTDNPYSLTVTETPITYYAFFSEPAKSVYCILKNHDTGKYLCLSGNGQAIMHRRKGSFSGISYDVEDGCYFENGLKTIPYDETVNNPLIVFKRVSTNADGKIIGDLESDVKMVKSNGESSKAISTQYLIGNINYPLTFSASPNYPNAYRIYSHQKRTVSGKDIDFDSYLCDDGRAYASLQSFEKINEATGIDWDIIYLTEAQKDGAFGVNANAKYTKGDKYYTSMYAPFAFKLLDGVNAYYLNPEEDNYDEKTNTLTLSQHPVGEIVQANMPVIIECNSANDPTNNRLLPVTPPNNYSYSYSRDDNILDGYNQVYDRNNYSYEDNKIYQSVTNNHDYMYVFSIKNNELGFYHYGGSTIPKNKAYLNLYPHTWEQIKEDLNPNNNVKLKFGHNTGNEDLNSINLFNDKVDDADLPIYNLQGVQVKNPKKGIYIRGGKKYLVK